MGRRKLIHEDQFHRFLWKYRNKIDNSVPWSMYQVGEMLGADKFYMSRITRKMMDEGRLYRLPKSHTYIVNDPRRYNAEGQDSLPGGKSDV